MGRSPICASASPGFPQDPPGDLTGGGGVNGRRGVHCLLAGRESRPAELLKLVQQGRGAVRAHQWLQTKMASASQQRPTGLPRYRTPPNVGVWPAPCTAPAVVISAPRLRAHVTRFRHWPPEVPSTLPCGPKPLGFPTAPTEGWDYTLADSGGDFGE